MRFPKKYFQDKLILLLLSINSAMCVLSVITIMLNVNTDVSSVSIVSYRASRAIQVSGPTSELYQFAIYAVLVTVLSIVLSMKLFAHRRHLSLSVLGLNIVTLMLCIVVFNALTRTL